jgi:hypothetical protein
MLKLSIFFIFWMLTTFAISRGDPIGIVLALTGFLFLYFFAEELEENG